MVKNYKFYNISCDYFIKIYSVFNTLCSLNLLKTFILTLTSILFEYFDDLQFI